VKVYKKPVVAILSTGNELVDLQATSGVSSPDGWGGIFDTNRPSLQAALESMGYEVLDLGIVIDEYESTTLSFRKEFRLIVLFLSSVSAHLKALQTGLKKADLVLTTGGTSMGPTDLLKPVIERYLNGTVHFGRVSIKPGKPTTFATIPMTEGNTTIQKPIFALPGNPASALVTFYIFVVPALRRLGGWPERMCALPRVQVQVSSGPYPPTLSPLCS
jgi:gephyrin